MLLPLVEYIHWISFSAGKPKVGFYILMQRQTNFLRRKVRDSRNDLLPAVVMILKNKLYSVVCQHLRKHIVEGLSYVSARNI